MMRRLLPSGIRPRLMVLIGFMVGTSTALMVYQAVRQRDEAIRSAASEAVLLSHLAAAYEERSVAVARHLLHELAAHDRLRAGDAGALQPLLESLAADESVGPLAVADGSGRVLASTRPRERGLDASASHWFRRAAGTPGFSIGREPGSEQDEGDVLRGALPVRDAAGRLLAVASAELEAGWLRHVAARARVPGHTSMLVVDPRGRLVAHYPSSLPHDRDSTIAIPAGATGDWTQDVRGGEGHRHIVAFTPLAGPGPGRFFVGVSVDQSAAFADTRQAFMRGLLLLLLAGACVSAIAWFGVEAAVVRRIHALVAAVGRLRSGDRSARTNLPYGRGELSQLARAFDDMAADLQHEYAVREEAEMRLRASEAHKSAVLEASIDGIVVLDGSGRVMDCNAAARRLFGCEGRCCVRHTASQLFRGVDLAAIHEPNAPARSFEAEGCRMDGTTFPIEIGLAPVRDREGWGLYVATIRDLTERKRWERSIQALTFVDDLTGLFNRRGFTMFATQQLRLAARNAQKVVLVSVDLDGLKDINDTYGHTEGDHAILELAVILRRSFRESDVIARFGGDEFVVLATESETAGAEVVLERLAERLALRNERGDLPWRLSASFGWERIDAASAPALPELLRVSDARMYEVKRARHREPGRTPRLRAGGAPAPAAETTGTRRSA